MSCDPPTLIPVCLFALFVALVSPAAGGPTAQQHRKHYVRSPLLGEMSVDVGGKDDCVYLFILGVDKLSPLKQFFFMDTDGEKTHRASNFT